MNQRSKVTQRVKAIYASHPKYLERIVNEYLETMPDVLDEIRFDHGTAVYEEGKRTYCVAYILHHPQPAMPY